MVQQTTGVAQSYKRPNRPKEFANTDEPNPMPVRDLLLPEPQDTTTVPVRGKVGGGRYKNKGSCMSDFGRSTWGWSSQPPRPFLPAVFKGYR
jgi:hypothetical protein